MNVLNMARLAALLLMNEELELEEQNRLVEEEHERTNNSLLSRLNNDSRLYSLHNGKKLDITTLPEETCIDLFRFTLPEITRIARAMQLPELLVFRKNTKQEFRKNTVFALAIMLRRLAYPSELLDLQLLFGLPKSTISIVFNEVVVMLHDRYKDKIRYNKKHFRPSNLRLFSKAVKDAGSPYTNISGFIGETILAVCRPIRNQRSVYSPHKKTHGLKYQAIVTPDGITASLIGPFYGAKHDATIFRESKIMDDLVKDLDLLDTTGDLYRIYGDPVYHGSVLFMKPYPDRSGLNALHKTINKKMSRAKICVEWEFERVTSLFAFLKFKPDQKILLSNVGMYYVIATLFKNIHVCLRGNGQTARRFELDPPDLEFYMEEMNPENEEQ